MNRIENVPSLCESLRNMRIVDASVVHLKTERSLQALVLLSAGLSGLSIALYGGLSSWVARDLDLRHVHSGMAQGVFFAGNLLAVAFAGRLAARYSLGLLWPAALVLISVGNLATGSPWFESLLVGRFLAGIGLASLSLVLTAFIVRRWPLHRVRLLSLLHATTAAAAALSLALGRASAETLGGWKPVFWTCALGTLGMAALLSRWPIPSYHRAEAAPTPNETPVNASTTPSAIPLGRVIALLWGYVAVEQALTVFLPALGERAFAITPAAASMLAATLWAGVIAGRLGTAAMPHLSERVLLIGGAVGMAYALLLGLGAGDEKNLAICVFAAGVLGGPIVPAGYGLASRVAGGPNSASISLCQLGCGLGGLGGPFFVGLAGDSLGLTIGLGWLALLLLGTAVVLFMPQARLLARKARLGEVTVADALA